MENGTHHRGAVPLDEVAAYIREMGALNEAPALALLDEIKALRWARLRAEAGRSPF